MQFANIFHSCPGFETVAFQQNTLPGDGFIIFGPKPKTNEKSIRFCVKTPFSPRRWVFVSVGILISFPLVAVVNALIDTLLPSQWLGSTTTTLQEGGGYGVQDMGPGVLGTEALGDGHREGNLICLAGEQLGRDNRLFT